MLFCKKKPTTESVFKNPGPPSDLGFGKKVSPFPWCFGSGVSLLP